MQNTTDKNLLNGSEIVNRVVMTGLDEEDPDISIQAALETFGKNIKCDRICIFEDSHQIDGYVDATYEWCAEGAFSIKGIMQGIPFHGTWDDCVDQFDQRQVFAIHNREEYRKYNERGYQAMLEWRTDRLIAYPLYIGDQYFGFVRIDNPSRALLEMDRIGNILKVLSGFFAPMIRLRKNIERLQYLSERDPMTETFNMVTLQNKILECIEYEGADSLPAMYVVYLDIVNSRKYNLEYGIEKGNEIIKSVAKILERVFGTDFLSRVAADRFTVFYTRKDVLRCVDEVHRQCLLLNEKDPVHVKMGIAEIKDPEHLQKTFADAKIACENLGEGNISFYGFVSSDLEKKLEKDQYILNHFEEALSSGNIIVYFQPVIRTMTEKLCSFEALARWKDSRYGMISPADFVPVLEDHELCWMLDEFVAKQVCSMLRERMDQGLMVVPVSVNLSRKDFLISNPLAALKQICRDYSMDHQYLCVEITESEMMQMTETVRDMIRECRNEGFQVWMDDFGSAYSSLNVLGRFSFDKIKLDRDFVKDGITETSGTIIRSAVWMAKEMGVRTLCEGVETEEQLAFLREIGCEEIQGFYYCKPGLLEDVLKTLEERGIRFESREEAEALKKVGNIHFSHQRCRMAVIRSGERIQQLYQSSSMRRIMERIGMTHVGSISDDSHSLNLRKLHLLMKKAAASDEEQRSVMNINDDIYLVRCKKIASFEDSVIELVEAIEITVMWNQKKYAYLYYCAAGAYEEIYLFDGEDRMLEVIDSVIEGEESGSREPVEVCGLYQRMHPDDRNRFKMLMEKEGRRKIIEKMRHGSYTAIFRIISEQDEYIWMAVTIIDILIDGIPRLLICVKPSAVEDYLEREHLISTLDRQLIPYRIEEKALADRSASEAKSADALRQGEMIRSLRIENMTDHLTGALNRRYFDREVVGRIVGAAAFLDIDNFKKINDVYGHSAGDTILREVSSTIRGKLRSTDTFIRYGGDEFIIIFDKISGSVLERRLKELQESVEQITFTSDLLRSVEVTVSIGACCRKGNVEDLIKEADKNMYQSKKRKGNITITY